MRGGADQTGPRDGRRGQLRVDDSDALDQALFALDEKELGQYGVVLEAHLERVTTFSVGQVRVGGRLASYYGTQRLTRDNAGNEVYGGSDLVVVDGDFEALLALDLPETTRLAVSQAQVYDEAASSCYRHFSPRGAITTSPRASTGVANHVPAYSSNPGASAVPAAPRSPRSKHSGGAVGCVR